MNTFRHILAFMAFGFFLISASSCKKIDDLLDTRSGDDKLQDLLTSGPWRVDSLVALKIDNSRYFPDTVEVNSGTFTFTPRDKTSGANYGVGYLIHSYPKTDNAGTHTQMDTTFWYAGNWGSISIDGVFVTQFMGTRTDHSFDERTDLHLAFETRSDNLIILTGTRTYTDLGNGSTNGFSRRYRLSK